MIIKNFSHLTEVYDDLGPGDLFVGQIPRSHLKAALLVDLTARGVRLLPSATARLLSVSKTAQAFLLRPWMLPHTRVIARRKELLDALGDYHRNGIAAAVTKQEHLHCGHGVRKWNDLDTLYSCLSLDERHFPFVLQPYRKVVRDVRVIMVGDYCEAYARYNPDGFRMNLAAGGSSRPFALSGDQQSLCRRIMARGQFPFAHIDLLATEPDGLFLSEISLNGGAHGARIAQVALNRKKQDHLAVLAAAMREDDLPRGGAAAAQEGSNPGRLFPESPVGTKDRE